MPPGPGRTCPCRPTACFCCAERGFGGSCSITRAPCWLTALGASSRVSRCTCPAPRHCTVLRRLGIWGCGRQRSAPPPKASDHVSSIVWRAAGPFDALPSPRGTSHLRPRLCLRRVQAADDPAYVSSHALSSFWEFSVGPFTAFPSLLYSWGYNHRLTSSPAHFNISQLRVSFLGRVFSLGAEFCCCFSVRWFSIGFHMS